MPHRITEYPGLALLCSAAVLLTAPALPARADELKPLSITLEEYAYPQQVDYLQVAIEGQNLRMAYMDVVPTAAANGRCVLLLHGKNFFGAYWKDTIRALTREGYRVIVPDQLGFGKSAKPDIHYSFHLLAATTKKLLDALDVKQVAVVGHSMGGMLAARFTLMYPGTVTRLILENPIGLEDYRSLLPYASLEELYKQEMKATKENILAYHKGYFVTWKPEYGEYAEVAARWKLSGEYPRLAMSSALTSQMIYEQPVCHEFPRIRTKTLLVIGQADRTVVAKARLPKELLHKAGQYPQLGRKTAALIPGAKLVELPDIGHIPHLEAADRFHEELLAFLER